jgi:hypothetical protein
MSIHKASPTHLPRMPRLREDSTNLLAAAARVNLLKLRVSVAGALAFPQFVPQGDATDPLRYLKRYLSTLYT